jgi:glucose-1-phosphate adenylyltransferase
MGFKNYEEKSYWRDVGTIESYWRSNMDLLGSKPKLDLNNSLWPIHSASRNSPPAKYIGAKIEDSMVSDGCEIRNSHVKKSILGRGVMVADNCTIEESIIMDKCEIKEGTKLKKVIIDRYNRIGPKRSIGLNSKADAQRYFIDPCGIVIIPRGKTRLFS